MALHAHDWRGRKQSVRGRGCRLQRTVDRPRCSRFCRESGLGCTCVRFDRDLGTIFAPSSTATNWNQFGAGNPDLGLTLYAPAVDSAAYATLDALLKGDCARMRAADGGERCRCDRGGEPRQHCSRCGTVGFGHDGVRRSRRQLNSDVLGCSNASAQSVEARAYPGAKATMCTLTVPL